jgi:hypothetical protein
MQPWISAPVRTFPRRREICGIPIERGGSRTVRRIPPIEVQILVIHPERLVPFRLVCATEKHPSVIATRPSRGSRGSNLAALIPHNSGPNSRKGQRHLSGHAGG